MQRLQRLCVDLSRRASQIQAKLLFEILYQGPIEFTVVGQMGSPIQPGILADLLEPLLGVHTRFCMGGASGWVHLNQQAEAGVVDIVKLFASHLSVLIQLIDIR